VIKIDKEKIMFETLKGNKYFTDDEGYWIRKKYSKPNVEVSNGILATK